MPAAAPRAGREAWDMMLLRFGEIALDALTRPDHQR